MNVAQVETVDDERLFSAVPRMVRSPPTRFPELHPAVLLPLVLSAGAYFPITRSFFFADDFVHLVDMQNEKTLVFLLKPFGGNAFLLRNLVFLGSYHLFGVDPVAFHWTVFVTHVLNVALLFGVLRAMTGSAWLACLGAAVWGVSPLALETLNWYAAFGHVLVGTALLLVLRSVVRIDAGGGRIPTRAAIAWFALLLAGSTCYGPGIGAALVFPVALVLLLPAAWRQPGVRLAFLALPPVTLGLYFVLQYLYKQIGTLAIEEIIHQQAALSGFDAIPPLWAQLLAYSAAGTMLGFFLPETYPSPAASGAVAMLAAALGLLLWRGSPRTRRLALGTGALWAGIYLMIAAGRGHVYSMLHVPPATAAAVGRYHYAGTIPLVVLLCLVLREAGRLPGLRAVPRALAVVVALVALIIGRYATDFRIDTRPFVHDYFLYTKLDLAGEIDAAPPGRPVYLENRETPRYVLGPAIPERLVPGRAAVFLLTRSSSGRDGREVHFIERDPEVLDWYRNEHPDTPLARLLVAPEETPAAR
jgi:hypothetical protein